ncbi:MAG: hypothetical protein JWP89_5993 [Schlesneria sp.]|nr:hypothetical protein [Schlesneria sp.]
MARVLGLIVAIVTAALDAASAGGKDQIVPQSGVVKDADLAKPSQAGHSPGQRTYIWNNRRLETQQC